MKKWLPVQKIIWNPFFLLVYRILHQKIFQKNQSKGVPRVKKNKQDLLLFWLQKFNILQSNKINKLLPRLNIKSLITLQMVSLPLRQ